MRSIHYISIIVAAGLIALLYFGVNTVPFPKKAPMAEAGGHQGEAEHMHEGEATAASEDSIITASRNALPAHAAAELEASENNIRTAKDSASMIPLLEEQSKLWQEHKMLPMAAILKTRAAYLAHSEKKLNFAGQIYMELLKHEEQPSMQLWEAQQAIGCFKEVLVINPDNDTVKLALAAAYVDGAHEPMKGVAVIREITAKDPNNIPANMVLGQMSIQSGQFDKAVTRFETVLKQEPKNKEALYFLAEAYKGKGDKTKAIELFEACKKLVNNPDFSKEVDNYINHLSNILNYSKLCLAVRKENVIR